MVPIYQIDVPEEKAEALRKLGFSLRQIPETSPKPSFDKSQFIKLEGQDYGYGIKWDDCDVAMARLSYSPEMVEISKKLGVKLQNTNKDSLGREFVGNINWEEALKLNLSLGGKTMTMGQYADFLKLLKPGKAYDGNGKKIDSKILENIFNDITQVKVPWRAE